MPSKFIIIPKRWGGICFLKLSLSEKERDENDGINGLHEKNINLLYKINMLQNIFLIFNVILMASDGLNFSEPISKPALII